MADRPTADSAPASSTLDAGSHPARGTGTPVGEARVRAATIYDVAKVAGVSHQTVSRYLQGFPGIRPETAARVAQALDELDYRPNLTARSLTTGRSRRIGALTHDIDKYGPSRILSAASAAASDAGYVLDIVALDTSDSEAIREALAMMTGRDVEGILALSSTDEMTRAFARVDFRMPALIAAEPDEPPHVESPFATVGVPALVAHLAELGHERIIHVAGPSQWSSARNRRRALEQAAERHGLRVVRVVEGDWSAGSGHRAISELDRLDATAVVTANDQMALGAMLALRQRGLAVPADVSVAGIDDIPDAAYYSPPLTTLRMNLAGRGRAACLELISRIDGSPAQEPAPVESTLVVRGSTGPAPRR